MRRSIKRFVSWMCAAAVLIQMLSLGSLIGYAQNSNLALNKPATATYEQMGDYNAYAGKAVDGDYSSRWSTYGGSGLPGAIQVDLGATCRIDDIATYWFGVGRTFTYSVYVTDQPMIIDSVLQTDGTPAAAGLTGKGSGSASSGTTAGTPGTTRTSYAFSTPATGRYLTIVCTKVEGGSAAAVLWELEVNGEQIGEVDSVNISRIPSFTDRQAAFGTPIENISLPDSTTVSLDNGQKQAVGLQWSCADYNGNQPGEYTFIGTPVLSDDSGISNDNGCLASAKVTVCQADKDLSGRQVVNISSRWSFKKGSAAASDTDYNDASWQVVDIPHTWNAEDGQDGGSNYYRGDGWYRKTLDWNDDYSGKRVVIHFEGANMQADVYVNGQFIGNHRADIPPSPLISPTRWCRGRKISSRCGSTISRRRISRRSRRTLPFSAAFTEKSAWSSPIRCMWIPTITAPPGCIWSRAMFPKQTRICRFAPILSTIRTRSKP